MEGGILVPSNPAWIRALRARTAKPFMLLQEKERGSMKTLRTLSAFLVLAAVAAGCSDSTAPEDITLAALVGTWSATSATFSEVGGSGFEDAIALGATMSITVGPSGSYSINVTVPFEDPEVETGTLTVTGGVITATPTDPLEDPETIEIVSLSGDNLTLFFADEEWDFTDDQIDNETPATLTIVMRRVQ